MIKRPKIKGYGPETVKVMGVAFELGFAIALPIILFGFLGKWLDAKEGTAYFIYLGIALAIILTSVWVYQRFAEMVKNLQDAANKTAGKVQEQNSNTESQNEKENFN